MLCKSLSLAEAALWKCNDQLAELNYERFAHMDLERQLTPAVLAYGLAYQYMAPGVMTEDMLSYLQEHLRISGFMGCCALRWEWCPTGWKCRRLSVRGRWLIYRRKIFMRTGGDLLYQGTRDADGVFINLASREYAKAVEKYIAPADHFITVEFCEQVEN